MRRILSAFTIALLCASCSDYRATVAEPSGSATPQPPIHGGGDGDVFTQPAEPVDGGGPPLTAGTDSGSAGSGGSGGSNPPAAAVPEPGTMLLVGSGLAAAAYARRRRRQADAAAVEPADVG